jgi:hypothetical protein
MMATMLCHSRRLSSALTTLSSVWQRVQTICTVSLPIPSGNWTWAWAGITGQKTAAAIKDTNDKNNFVNEAPPFRRIF